MNDKVQKIEPKFNDLDALFVVEDKEYVKHLVNKSFEKVKLYKVIIYHPAARYEIHVLANCEAAACSQASTILPRLNNNYEERIEEEISYHAYQLPVLLRGWSNYQF